MFLQPTERTLTRLPTMIALKNAVSVLSDTECF
jgi:hypothetical protein